MTTDVKTLPHFGNRPVPWITRWTNEKSADRYEYAVKMGPEGKLILTYGDGKDIHDKYGVLWQREGITRGGEPMYADVSTFRQRAAMLKQMCQVCGKKIDTQLIRWIMPLGPIPGVQWEAGADRPFTMNAPNCDDCVDLALKLCPNLRTEGYSIIRVLDYSIYGTFGILNYLNPEGHLRRSHVQVPYDLSPYDSEHPYVHGAMLAQQMVAQLDKFTIEETVKP